jgi:hypothetical protein
MDETCVAAAVKCARGVIESIRQGIFWPPASSLRHDDFSDLWFRDAAESFDASLLEKYRELRKTN